MFGGGGFEEQYGGAVFGDGVVFDAFGDDVHVAFVEVDSVAISELDGKLAFEDEEEFIFVFVGVPGEVTFEFGKFDLLAVELGDDFGCPCFIEEAEFVGEVDNVAHIDAFISWCHYSLSSSQ